MSGVMRVLLLSAYDAQSHRAWYQGLLRALPEIDWVVESLPARYFAWRFRGNALTWAFQPSLRAPYDRVLATSMTDLATLRGLVPRFLSVPALVYFHENQFAYPVEQAHPRDQVHHQITQIYTALAADRVLFNSDYNRVSFLEGARRLLAKMPDGVPQGWDAQIVERSGILPVPLDAPFFQTPEPSNGPLHLLWNHRWEYDKEPARFFAALALLRAWDVPFCLHVVGQQFRTQPACFAEARETFRKEIQTWGYLADRSAYQRLLRRCDLVISTALHEFQGLSVLEACASGCLPLVPDRLAYPQFIPALWRYPSTPEDPQAEAHALASTLARWSLEREVLRKMPRLDVSGLSWESLGPQYRAILVRDPRDVCSKESA